MIENKIVNNLRVVACEEISNSKSGQNLQFVKFGMVLSRNCCCRLLLIMRKKSVNYKSFEKDLPKINPISILFVK